MGAARMERDEENHRFVTTIISLHDMHGNNVVIYACMLTMCSSADAFIYFYTDNPNYVRVDFCRASQFHPLVCLVVANINTSTPFKVDVGMLEFLHAMVAMAAPCIAVLAEEEEEEEEAAVMVMELRVVVLPHLPRGETLVRQRVQRNF